MGHALPPKEILTNTETCLAAIHGKGTVDDKETGTAGFTSSTLNPKPSKAGRFGKLGGEL